MPIETLIVDDHEDIRLLWRMMLEAQDGITVVGEAATGEEAVDRYRALRPEVIILDEMMPGMSGLDVVRELRDSGEQPHIVLCSAQLDRAIVETATELGVACCVTKNNMQQAVADIRELAEADPEAG